MHVDLSTLTRDWEPSTDGPTREGDISHIYDGIDKQLQAALSFYD